MTETQAESTISVGLPARRGAGGGQVSSHAALLRMGARVAEEGGGDVPSTWARARS